MMINSIYVSGKQPERQLFFRGSMLDIYQAENNLFGFTYYRDRGFWEIFNAEPIYLSPEEALQRAKQYSVISSVKLDTKNIRIATDFHSGIILCQSRLTKRYLGKTDGYQALDLYPNEHDRAHICKKVRIEKRVQAPVRLQNLDGKIIKGFLDVELVEIGCVAIAIETFRPDAVPHFQSKSA